MTELTTEAIEKLLLTNDKAVGRALVALMNRQTEDEKRATETKVYNARGFTPADAHSGTISAFYFLKHGKLEQWQLDRWRKLNAKGKPRICKYTKQLIEVAKEKQAEKAVQNAPKVVYGPPNATGRSEFVRHM